MHQFDTCPKCNTFFSILEIKSDDSSIPESFEAICCPNNSCKFSRDEMTNGHFKTTELNESVLSNVTLRALVNSLQRNGHDLDKIIYDYEQEILGNRLSGASPEYKFSSTSYLKNLADEAKINSELK